MATASTGWLCTHSASITSSSNTSVTITVTCYWKNNGWTYDINNVSAWVYCNGQSKQVKSNGSVTATGSSTKSVSMGSASFTINKSTANQNISCYAKITSNSSYVSGTKSSSASTISVPAKPSYTVSYSANGGSGAPGNQTKWYGSNLTLSSTKPTRTGYSFLGWATSSSGGVSYASGGTYSANASITLYAVWSPYTYTIGYSANGGTGAPGNQIKTYGVNLVLSTIKPTRTNYNFLGWATSSGGSVTYQPGSTYTANASVTLYAIWQLAYQKPRISGFKANRCTSAGDTSDNGTYLKVGLTWATDRTVSAIVFLWKKATDSSWTSSSITASGTSGTVSSVIGNGEFDANTSYTVQMYVQDSGGTTYTSTLNIGTVAYPIDVYRGGDGIAFGKAAETSGLMDINFNLRVRGYLEKNLRGVGGASTWITGRDNALIRNTTYSSNAWCPTISMGSVSGDWCLGTINASAYLAYTSDSNYSANSNIVTHFAFSTDGRLVSVVDNTTIYSLGKNSSGFIGFDNNGGYLRTPTAGLLPNTSTSGGLLGTSAWPFSGLYLKYFRIPANSEWIGFYDGGSTRKGWIGHNTSTNMSIYNETGGAIDFYNNKHVVRIGTNNLILMSTGVDRGIIINWADGLGHFLAYVSQNNLDCYFGPTNFSKTNQWSNLQGYCVHIKTHGGAFTASRSMSVSSDKRVKENIETLNDKYIQFFNGLEPVSYSYITNTHGRRHLGFVAQDVEKSLHNAGLTNKDFAGLVIVDKFKDEDDSEELDNRYFLSYEEFIPLNTKMIQLQQKQIEELKNQVKQLQDLVLNLKEQIENDTENT